MHVLLLLVACEPDDDGGAAETGDSAVVGAPSIATIDRVGCAERQSAGEVWDFSLTVDDPEGPDTVDEGVLHVRDPDGAGIAEYPYPCDDAGTCFGSFLGRNDGISCAMGPEVVFAFDVTDRDGNRSAELVPEEVPCEPCSAS